MNIYLAFYKSAVLLPETEYQVEWATFIQYEINYALMLHVFFSFTSIHSSVSSTPGILLDFPQTYSCFDEVDYIYVKHDKIIKWWW